MLITRDDLQRIGDEETLLHFLEEKLNLPIPEGATLAQIALPLPLPFLGLDDSISEHIIDCQDFSGFSQDTLGDRRPFLIRFRRESDFSEVLRKVAKGLSQQDINPDKIFFICGDEYFKPFAFAYFGDSDTEDWYAEVLNILTWTQGNTRINTGFEHDLSAILSADKFSKKPNDSLETKNGFSNNRGASNLSENLLIKLQNIGTPLGRHKDIHIYIGIATGCHKAFVIDEHIREELLAQDSNSTELIERIPKPGKWACESTYLIWLQSSKNKRWPWSGVRDELEAERVFKETYPAISAHLSFYIDRLKKRTALVDFYWEFPASNLYSMQETPKITYRATHTSMQAAYTTLGGVPLGPTFFIPTTELSLLAILNSKLFNWYTHKKFWLPQFKKVAFAKQNMVKAPIIPTTEAQKTELSDLVQQILDDPDNFEVPDIEWEIDQLVYKLYKLTDAEIALIEKGNNP